MAPQASSPPRPDPVDNVDGAAPVLLKLSEVRRQTGVDVDTLKMLIEDNLLVRGVERSANGHVYMRANCLPTHQALLALLREQLKRELRAA
jgi:hypothetical protein